MQVGTGLFANDDIAFEGPFFNFIDKDFSDKLTSWHNSSLNVLLGLIALHLMAIVYYRAAKKTDLVKPMLTGKKEVPVALAEAIDAGYGNRAGGVRFALSLLISGTVSWGASGGITQLPQITRVTNPCCSLSLASAEKTQQYQAAPAASQQQTPQASASF